MSSRLGLLDLAKKPSLVNLVRSKMISRLGLLEVHHAPSLARLVSFKMISKQELVEVADEPIVVISQAPTFKTSKRGNHPSILPASMYLVISPTLKILKQEVYILFAKVTPVSFVISPTSKIWK